MTLLTWHMDNSWPIDVAEGMAKDKFCDADMVEECHRHIDVVEAGWRTDRLISQFKGDVHRSIGSGFGFQGYRYTYHGGSVV